MDTLATQARSKKKKKKRSPGALTNDHKVKKKPEEFLPEEFFLEIPGVLT